MEQQWVKVTCRRAGAVWVFHKVLADLETAHRYAKETIEATSAVRVDFLHDRPHFLHQNAR